jgi:DNA-binding transcriptional ArsR family regulator
MTSTDLYVAMEEADSAWFGSLSERCIYHYLLFHADKKGVFRLAMTELASVLDVKRQTVQKHVDSLIEKRLVRRVGHGRYRVYREPWSLDAEVRAYLDSLKPGAVIDPTPICLSLWGKVPGEMYGDTPWGPKLDSVWAAFGVYEGTRIREDYDSGQFIFVK